MTKYLVLEIDNETHMCDDSDVFDTCEEAEQEAMDCLSRYSDETIEKIKSGKMDVYVVSVKEEDLEDKDDWHSFKDYSTEFDLKSDVDLSDWYDS